MPRAVQARDRSADGNFSTRYEILTTSQSPRVVARRRWRLPATNRMGLAHGTRRNRKWILRTIELSTQTPIISSMLSFIAMHTEVTSSPAFACKSCQVKPSEVMWVTYDNGEKHKTDKCLRYIEPVAVSSIDVTTKQNWGLSCT